MRTAVLPPLRAWLQHPMLAAGAGWDQIASRLTPRLHPAPSPREFLPSPTAFVARLAHVPNEEATAAVAETPVDHLVHEMMSGIERGIPARLARAQAPPPTPAWQGMLAGLFGLVRLTRPATVVETGVGLMGASSTFILEALDRNGGGELWSVDADRYFPLFGVHVGQGIPPRLQGRHHLVVGDSRQHLGRVLAECGGPQIFLHDSLHTYRNMTFEFRAGWQHLRPGGILLSDDATNSSFDDFAAAVRGRPLFFDCGSIFAGMSRPD